MAGGNRRLAVDRCEPWGAKKLVQRGIKLFDAQEAIEQARAIKTPEELKCLQLSMDVCDLTVERIRSKPPARRDGEPGVESAPRDQHCA
jgi:Xaa-Pro aminopeptidase